jgi:hypothetical protein
MHEGPSLGLSRLLGEETIFSICGDGWEQRRRISGAIMVGVGMLDDEVNALLWPYPVEV